MPDSFRGGDTLAAAKSRLRQRSVALTPSLLLRDAVRRHPATVIALSVLSGALADRAWPGIVRLLRDEPQWVLRAVRFFLRDRRLARASVRRHRSD